MEYIFDNGTKSKNGFIYVATGNSMYAQFAYESANSLKDYYEGANITLFVNRDLVTDNLLDGTFDKVICDIPVHYRAKMYAMANSPYKGITAYIDADSYINDEMIENFFDELGDHDIMFGPTILSHVGHSPLREIIKGESPKLHGGVCLFNNKKKTRNFIMSWFEEYCKQTEIPREDWDDEISYEWRHFDMLTLWKMSNNYNNIYPKVKNLKIGLFDHIWNATSLTLEEEINSNSVIIQVPKETLLELRIHNEADRIKLPINRGSTFPYN